MIKTWTIITNYKSWVKTSRSLDIKWTIFITVQFMSIIAVSRKFTNNGTDFILIKFIRQNVKSFT
ncbi:hypothetical protein DMT40_18060 [Klebsiella variicola]|nr:hypothetical protein DMT40_18060 [Klebsiella variicola]